MYSNRTVVAKNFITPLGRLVDVTLTGLRPPKE
jgi:hypothetical protein